MIAQARSPTYWALRVWELFPALPPERLSERTREEQLVFVRYAVMREREGATVAPAPPPVERRRAAPVATKRDGDKRATTYSGTQGMLALIAAKGGRRG